jgi:hypothetical protein
MKQKASGRTGTRFRPGDKVQILSARRIRRFVDSSTAEKYAGVTSTVGEVKIDLAGNPVCKLKGVQGWWPASCVTPAPGKADPVRCSACGAWGPRPVFDAHNDNLHGGVATAERVSPAPPVKNKAEPTGSVWVVSGGLPSLGKKR